VTTFLLHGKSKQSPSSPDKGVSGFDSIASYPLHLDELDLLNQLLESHPLGLIVAGVREVDHFELRDQVCL
jgi:hypothetical protein